MNETRKKELFESYFHYWVMKLKLHKKYRFIIKKDNRMNCHACISLLDKPNNYEVRYNTSMLKSQYKIISVVLHELGHIFLDWRYTDPIIHEAEAEYFSLSTMRDNYPKFYKKALDWTKRAILEQTTDEVHIQGYAEALQKLGEL